MSRKGLHLVGILLIGVISLKCTDTPNDFDEADNINNKSEYSLNVGETFTIELHQNGSTGYSNCWINQTSCTVIEEENKRYESSIKEKAGYVGSGGSTFWTFKAVKLGIDTLKIQSCPTGRLGHDCDFFSQDSIQTAEGSGNNKHDSQQVLSILVKVE